MIKCGGAGANIIISASSEAPTKYFNPIQHPLCIRYVCTMHVLLSFRCHIFQMFLFLMLLFCSRINYLSYFFIHLREVFRFLLWKKGKVGNRTWTCLPALDNITKITAIQSPHARLSPMSVIWHESQITVNAFSLKRRSLSEAQGC